YTADVRVDVPKAPEVGKPAAPAAAAVKPALAETALTERVEFIFDPTRYDAAKKQVEIPVRIRNKSSEPIYPPIRLEVDGFGFPQWESEDDKKRNAENAPTALNSSNGKPKEGATFDLGSTIAGSEALQPGALSNPFVIRLQLVDPTKMPGVRLKA